MYDLCFICEQQIMDLTSIDARDAYSVTCARCGRYQLTRTASVNIRNTTMSNRQRANMSGWISENPGFEISSTNLDSFLVLRNPSFHSRADKLLLHIEKETDYAGEYLIKEPLWISSSWCLNDDELNASLEYLEYSNRLHKQIDNKQALYKIIYGGWEHLERLKEVNPDSNQCFMAMWFDDQLKLIYDNAFAKAVSDAGYKPHRVDQREYNDNIDDEIIVQIKRSLFVVADFTGHRGGVYYEAGYAKGLGLEVIWTCRQDDIDKLHFDIRQYNFIEWDTEHLPEFAEKLRKRIESVFGQGQYRP